MLSKEQLLKVGASTLQKTGGIGLANAKGNLKYIKQSIRDLKKQLKDTSPKPAFIISAGPSLHRKESIKVLKEFGFPGYIIAADGALGHCLRNGIVPDFVLTVDPDEHRIIRWFGDPKLNERPEDDYFKRQDLDPEFNTDQIAKNNEMLELVDKYAPSIKLIISSSVSTEVTERCVSAGFDMYWWNPVYDDFDDKDSITNTIYEMNHAPCMVTGGNVGTSAWAFAATILKCPEIVMTGMDFSYPPGTDVYNTQYYDHLKEILPDNPAAGLIEVYNPHLDETWLTDLAYYWYRENFLEMSESYRGVTYNCTEGGILFGENIQFKSLKETLTLLKRRYK